jgi:hypothetical protein
MNKNTLYNDLKMLIIRKGLGKIKLQYIQEIITLQIIQKLFNIFSCMIFDKLRDEF